MTIPLGSCMLRFKTEWPIISILKYGGDGLVINTETLTSGESKAIMHYVHYVL